MNTELFGTKITEVSSGGNTAYILEEEDMYYDIGFRVMENQKSDYLLPCHKLKYNGKIKFVYFTDGLISLDQIVRAGDNERITAVFRNLSLAVTDVHNSGFLNISCIDARINKIYVSLNDYSIRLIYLPINDGGETLTVNAFESGVREQIAGCSGDSFGDPNRRLQNSATAQWKLVSIANNRAIPITKSYFKIGKSGEMSDGVIDWNKAISRMHCEIAFGSDGSCFIRDLNSANGTFVDGQRITTDPFIPIDESSQIKLANELFCLRR